MIMDSIKVSRKSLANARLRYGEGLSQVSAGNEQAARQCFLEAIALDDSLVAAYYELGNCLRRSGEALAAEQPLKTAILKDPSHIKAYLSLTYLYISQGMVNLATKTLEALVSVHPADVPLRHQVAGLLADMGQHALAAALYEECLRHRPHSSHTHLKLGQSLQKLGRFEEATRAFLAAIEHDPKSDAAYLLLAHTRRVQPTDSSMIRRFETVLNNPNSSEETIKCIHFGLGKIYDDLGQFEQAFSHYQLGNNLQHHRVQFDRRALAAYVETVNKVFSPEFFNTPPAALARNPTPVFIVGMLRSGTTLVERILASHPKIHSLGETELIDGLAEQLSARLGMSYPDCAAVIDSSLLDIQAVELQARWLAQAGTATRILDKNPLNFLHLGLIARIFPSAHILHCVRDPLDTCLSIYFQYLAHPRNNYAYDLEDIAYFYTQYRILIKHWHAVLPVHIHEIQYEQLVKNPEGTSRELIATLGLEWHPNCLHHEGYTENISTASLWQARQPIYGHAVGRWRNYEKHLGSLREALKAYI
jgi:tetratricopeptide (TPR) repeat protein